MKITEFKADVITTAVRNAMIEKSNVLDIAEFYPITGNADFTRKKTTVEGGEFRSVNQNFTSNTVNPEFVTPTLKIFGGQVQTDRAHERRGADIASVRASDLLSFAGSLGRAFQNAFYNGDATINPKEFNGIKKIVPNSQKLVAGADGLEVKIGSGTTERKTQQQFLELLDTLIQMVDGGAQVIAMDGALLSRLTTIARENITYNIDDFGRQIAYYNGIPIKVAGYDNNGNKIIGFNETVGLATECTSVYAFRFGEKENLCFATNPFGLEVKDLGLVGVHYTYSVDFDLDLVLLNDRAIAKLEGIKLG